MESKLHVKDLNFIYGRLKAVRVSALLKKKNQCKPWFILSRIMIILKNEAKHQQLCGSAQQLRNFVHFSSTSAIIASTALQSSLLRILPVLSETPSVSIMLRGDKLTGCCAEAYWRKRWAEPLHIIHRQDLCAASRNNPTLFKHVLIKLCMWLFCNKWNLFSVYVLPQTPVASTSNKPIQLL